jgi:hypothetical protein
VGALASVPQKVWRGLQELRILFLITKEWQMMEVMEWMMMQRFAAIVCDSANIHQKRPRRELWGHASLSSTLRVL